MSLQVAAQLAQLEQVVSRKKPCLGPGRIEQRGRVALRQDEPVVVVVVGVLRVIAHVSEEQCGYDVRGRAAGSWMAAAGGCGGCVGGNPKLGGDAFQAFKFDIMQSGR